MLGFFETVFKLLKFEKIQTDNFVFRLHYKFTFPVLVMFSLMLTSTQYFGNPIDCLTNGVEKGIVNTYCWTHGTYTVQNLPGVTNKPPTQHELELMQRANHNGVAHPGMLTSDPTRNRRLYSVFYQWVAFVLFLQGVCFYAPRFLWKKALENGKMKFLTSGMREPTLDDDEMGKRVIKLTMGYDKLKGKNNTYAVSFFSMEIFNFLNVCFQMYLTNMFLGGKFFDYGTRVLEYVELGGVEWNWHPMDEVFPKISKCQFNKHGVGGGIQTHDAMCMLPLNIVNEKIYLMLWVWYIILSVLSGLAIIYRIICYFCPDVRAWRLSKPQHNWAVIAKICQNKRYGDWFLLSQMSKNVDDETFSEFLNILCKDVTFVKGYKNIPDATWMKSRGPPGQQNVYSDSDTSINTQQTDFGSDNCKTMEKK